MTFVPDFFTATNRQPFDLRNSIPTLEHFTAKPVILYPELTATPAFQRLPGCFSTCISFLSFLILQNGVPSRCFGNLSKYWKTENGEESELECGAAGYNVTFLFVGLIHPNHMFDGTNLTGPRKPERFLMVDLIETLKESFLQKLMNKRNIH